MPKITISERDLTLIPSTDVTQNIVYVPGIGNKTADSSYSGGPVLYTTASEFKKDFTTYTFVENQTTSFNDISYQAGEYEKSYLYATELLQAGLQVLYEQVVDVSDYEKGASVQLTPAQVTQETFPNPNNGEIWIVSAASVTEEDFYDGEYFTRETTTKYNVAYEYESGVQYYTITAPEEYVEGLDYFTREDIAAHIEDGSAVEDFYRQLLGDSASERKSVYDKLQDRWTYNFKYLTTGGYPTLLDVNSASITDTEKLLPMMAAICAVRGDSIALIDTAENENLEDVYNYINLINTSLIESLYIIKPGQTDAPIYNISYSTPANRLTEITLKYAALFGPVGIYSLLSVSDRPTAKFSGSFGYLKCLANAINTYKSPNYFAIAGVTRGKVPNLLGLNTEVTGALAEEVQQKTTDKLSLNPIVNVQGYGLCIWGNRTLYPNSENNQLIASSFLNIRVMAADVKKTIYAACKKYTFETNSTELWLKFKSEITPLLDKMVADGALEDYNLTKNTTTEKATLSVTVELVTLYAVEDFDITIELTDSTIEVAE